MKNNNIILHSIIKDVIKVQPKPNHEIGQYFINQRSCVQRVEKIRDLIPSGRVLFVGDDDLISIVLSLFENYHISVIDMDSRILSIIKKNSISAKTINFDIRNLYLSIYPLMEAQYDIFITDPPYSTDGMLLFTGLGIHLLKIGGIGLVANYSNPKIKKSLYTTKILTDFINSNGCIIQKIEPKFQKSLSPSNKICQLIILKKVSEVDLKYKDLQGYNYFYHTKE